MSHAWLERLRRYTAVLALAATASFLMLAAGANAATIVVKNTTELEKAVTTANGNTEANTIELTAGTYLPLKTMVFTNTHGTQTLAGPVGKTGEATPGAKISGASVTPTPPTEQELLTVSAGVSLAVKHVVVTGGGSASNSAVEDQGSLNVENSTIDGNTGTQINVHGGATASLTNSTLADGLELGMADEGEASFVNVTVVHNASDGIGGTGSGKLSLTNTIVALNEGSAQCGSFSTLTNDHSLASDASCGGEAAFQGKTPLLQTSLLSDGGSTTIYSEKAGSPTIDAGDSAKCPATDQRGYPRPDVASTACDIGADEYSPTPPTITVPAEIVTPTTGTGAVVTYSVEATDPDALVKSLSCLPASGSTFKAGTTTVNCTAVDGHENKATASFNVKVTTPKHTLTVTSTGEGTVTSTPAGIECGQGHTACSAEFEEVAVTLTPAPATGYSVAWGGACSGTGSCSFNPMSANEAVTATFSAGPVNTGLPAISGTPYNGQTLKTTNGTWTGSPTSYKYQWEDCNETGAGCSSIVGATGQEYTLTSADIGHTIRVLVNAINSSGESAAESAPTAVVKASVGVVVEGKVPFTQTLATTCSPVVLGPFVPGKPQEYKGTCGLTATSTAAESKLVAEDASATDTGHLVQVYTDGAFKETYELPAALETNATSTQGGSGGALVSLAPSPATLLTYAKPFSEDAVTVTFNQKIGLHDHLHTGTYAKTITLTLSTTTP
jgi:hypothetical protein